jgi:hypothetical protein
MEPSSYDTKGKTDKKGNEKTARKKINMGMNRISWIGLPKSRIYTFDSTKQKETTVILKTYKRRSVHERKGFATFRIQGNNSSS